MLPVIIYAESAYPVEITISCTALLLLLFNNLKVDGENPVFFLNWCDYNSIKRVSKKSGVVV